MPVGRITQLTDYEPQYYLELEIKKLKAKVKKLKAEIKELKMRNKLL